MKTPYLVILAGLSPTLFQITGSVAWALQAPDFSVSAARAPQGIEITALPPAKNHINIQAPMTLSPQGEGARIKPLSAQEQKVVFLVPFDLRPPFQITLYLCDDQKTYCEKHGVSFDPGPKESLPLASPSTPRSETPSTPKKKTSVEPAKKNSKVDSPFILNDAEKALQIAKEEKRPLLIDFFGIWCPPCNMMDEEVFSQEAFREKTASFVRLKLDGDSESSWKLKSRYKIRGYPTILFADSNGEEILRVVGYLAKKPFFQKVDQAWNSRHQSFAILKKKADLGDRLAFERVGLTHLERGEFEQAIPYLSQIPQLKEQLLLAEVGVAEKKGEEAFLLALERAIQSMPEVLSSIEWRSKAAELSSKKDPVQSKAHLKEAIRVARDWIAHPERLAHTEFSLGDLWASLASAQEGDEARESWKKAAEIYGKNAGSGHERGYNLERAFCLKKAGEFAQAEALYQALEKKYPEEFTFYYAHASMELERKSLASAEKLASLALKYSYGDNRLRATHLLARVYQEGEKRAEGAQVIRSTLDTYRAPEDESIRSHRYLKMLRELLSKLSA